MVIFMSQCKCRSKYEIRLMQKLIWENYSNHICLLEQNMLQYELGHEKTCFCICISKSADELHGDRAADQCLSFCYFNSMIPCFLD